MFGQSLNAKIKFRFAKTLIFQKVLFLILYFTADTLGFSLKNLVILCVVLKNVH